MSFHSWLQSLRPAPTPRRGQRHHGDRGSLRAATHRLNLEALEDRRLLAFLTPVVYDLTGPIGGVTADFNGDGKLDLATANLGSGNVGVLAGQRRWHLPGPPILRHRQGLLTPSQWGTSTATASSTS